MKRKSVTLFLTEAGMMAGFLGKFLWSWFRPRFESKELLKQFYVIGVQSLPLIGLTGFIMGLVLTMQLRPAMVDYGVETQIPTIVSISIIREIGPVITALIFAGKIGSRIGAELGSMRVTEQIDAMEVSGTNPFKYLVVTRVMATTLMLPLLVVISDAISLYGAYLGVNIKGHTSMQLYWMQVFDAISFNDVIPAFIKTFFFGCTVGIVGCYEGYFSRKGTEGVGKSANASVVISSILIFIIDLLAVQITEILGLN